MSDKYMEDYHFKNFDEGHNFPEADKGEFKTASFVKSCLNFKKQRLQDNETKLDKKVQSKVREVHDTAFKEGYEEGIREGKKEVYANIKQYSGEEMERLKALVDEVVDSREEILKQQERDICHLVKYLAKWIVLRELKEDDDYIKRLVQKLLGEISMGQKFLVKIGRQQFENAPELLDMIKGHMEGSTNVRVEVSDEIHDKGVIVDSENVIIKATLKEQFEVLDQVFESVGLTDEYSREAA